MKQTASKSRYNVPDREAIRAVLHDLLSGATTLEAVNDWAAEFILYDDPQVYPEVSDPVVWEVLKVLHGCDTKVFSECYLHEKEDITRWLSDFEQACDRA